MFKRLRRFSAYLVVKVVIAAAETLPRCVGRPLFGVGGRLGYLVASRARKVALANLRLIHGPAVPDKELVSIARTTFINLAKFAYDAARVGRETPESLRAMVEVTGLEHLDCAVSKGKGVIALTGHVGNWELLGAYLSSAGYPVSVIATRLRDPRLNEAIVALRRSAGIKVLDRSLEVRGALRCLRQGEVLGVLIDQDTSVDSMVVDFLGKPARTAVGPVKLATRTGASIVPLAMLMTEDGRYHIHVSEALAIKGGDASLAADVEKCSKAVEAFIRKDLTQWVWIHKRWKSAFSEIYA